jgi:hypothetical protein
VGEGPVAATAPGRTIFGVPGSSATRGSLVHLPKALTERSRLHPDRLARPTGHDTPAIRAGSV